MRVVKTGEQIIESTRKEGGTQGLFRAVYKFKVVYALIKDSKEIAKVIFDANLNEIDRKDDQGLLKEFSSETINAINK